MSYYSLGAWRTGGGPENFTEDNWDDNPMGMVDINAALHMSAIRDQPQGLTSSDQDHGPSTSRGPEADQKLVL